MSAPPDGLAARKKSVTRPHGVCRIFVHRQPKRGIRMARVGQKVSGRFRTVAFARAMAPPGRNPPLAVALQGKSVDCLGEGT